MERLIAWLVLISIPLLTFLIISLPFFLVKKIKRENLRWLDLCLALFLAIIGFLLLQVIIEWSHRWAYLNIYNSGWLLDAMLYGLEISWLLTGLFIFFLPFSVCFLKYGQLTKKRLVLCLLGSIGLGILVLVGFIYFMVWQMGQAFMKYLN